MASSPAFASGPRLGVATISTANSNRDGSGTVGAVLTAGASGSLVERVTITAVGTTTNGMVRIYVTSNSGAPAAGNTYLLAEVAVSAATPGATVKAFTSEVRFPTSTDDTPGLPLPSGYALLASTEKGESFDLVAWGSDF